MKPRKEGCAAGRCAVVSATKGGTCRKGRIWQFRLSCGAVVQRAIHTSNTIPKVCACSIGAVRPVAEPTESERAA